MVLELGATKVADETRRRMGELSAAERRVARALLASYPSAGLTTVAELAFAAGVSAPTVVRFASRIGYSGYSELQRALLHEIDEDFGSPLRKLATSPGVGDDLNEAAEAFTSTVRETFAALPPTELHRLVQLLADPHREIVLTGGRFSRLLADNLSLHLGLIRNRVRFVPTDEVARLSMIADAGPSTVVVVFDYRRYTEETLRLAHDVRDRGATVVLFTDAWLSPIAKIADVVIAAVASSPWPWDSIVPAMALVETVIGEVTRELGDAGRSRLELVEATRLAGTTSPAGSATGTLDPVPGVDGE